jgi:glycoside/pentoside/hexuronide:cation symporter, GPH family
VTKQQILRPPLSILWIYSLGQLGWSLATYSVGSLLTYFYMPPEQGDVRTIFPNFISHSTFLGLTIIGIIAFGGRVLDAFIDPFIANLSDKTSSRFGKRKVFMSIAALPLAMFSYLIFKPLTEGVSFSNTAWLVVSVFLFYVSLAFYVIPYNALMSELGHVKEDRVKISTFISITWAIGFLIGNGTPALQGFFEKNGLSSVVAFQKAIGIFAFISLIFMLLPVLFLDENKYTVQSGRSSSFKESIRSISENKQFRTFLVMNLLYWISLSFIQLGMIYYVTLLFGFDKTMATTFGVVSFFMSFLFYPFMGIFEKKYGKKRTISLGFILLAITFIIFLLPIAPSIRFWVISVLAAFPLAAFGILSNTIVVDIVHKNNEKTGKNESAMFYGVTAFMMKLGISVANLIFPSFLVLGKSVENPLGVQLSLVAAFLFCGLGFWVFQGYED